MSWVETKLGDALQFYNGKAGKYEGGNYPVYGSNGLIGTSDTAIFDNGIIIGRVGAYCGAVQYCPSQFWASDNTIVVKNQDGYDIKYLAYLLEIMDLNQFAGGSAQPLLTHGWIKPISIKMPPLPIQQKIAGILSAYDDLIENNLKRIKLLEEMAQITYEEWFVRLRFPGHESTPINPETKLPEGWEKKKLNEIANFVFGYPFKANQFNTVGNGTPIVRIRNIPNSSTTDYTTEVVAEKYVIERGDLLVGMDGDFYVNNWTSDRAYLVQRVCNIKPKDRKILGYVTEAIKAPVKFYEATISGATVAHLGKKHLDEIEIIYPAVEMKKHCEMLNKILEEKLHLSQQNQRLRGARDILLPRLMTGMIDVEQFDPAKLLNEAA